MPTSLLCQDKIGLPCTQSLTAAKSGSMYPGVEQLHAKLATSSARPCPPSRRGSIGVPREPGHLLDSRTSGRTKRGNRTDLPRGSDVQEERSLSCPSRHCRPRSAYAPDETAPRANRQASEASRTLEHRPGRARRMLPLRAIDPVPHAATIGLAVSRSGDYGRPWE